MKVKILVSTIVAFYTSYLLSPPDQFTAIVWGAMSALVCCVTLLILARYKFVKSSPNSMHKLVCILVCMVSVLLMQWYSLIRLRWAVTHDETNRSSSTETLSRRFNIGSLHIEHLSDRRGFFSKETECLICSVDSPKTYSYDGETFTLTFPDSNCVEFHVKDNETI